MSTIPSRTRSLRKPSDASTSSRYGRVPAPSSSIEPSDPTVLEKRTVPRSGQSPSRLPTKPTTRSATSSTRPPSSNGSVASNTSMRPPPPRANISKPATANASGLQRSTSTRRPSDATQNGSSIGLGRSTSVRRPSDTTRGAATTAADPVKQDRSRPPLTQYKHLRTASTSTTPSATSTISSANTSTIPQRGHTRNKSSSTLLTNPTSLWPPSRDANNEPKTTHSDPTSLLERKKASFSTYQQHFSPAKSLAPKPHPAAFLAPPSPSKLPSNIAISAETAKLQNELLQLHLLHKDSVGVTAQWKDSAKKKLGTRFQHVVAENERLVQLEAQESGKINAAALKKWQDKGVPGLGLAERTRILDEILTGVYNFGDSGGKYARLVRRFEKWLVRNEDVRKAREHGEELEGDEVLFVEPLDQGWKDELLHTERRLQAWGQDLHALGLPDGSSGLRNVLERLGDLVGGMVEEVNVMRSLEDEMVRRESDWIKGMIDDVTSDDNDDDGANRVVAGAIWRRR